MFEIESVDRKIEMFIFDIYIAILKIKKVVSEFNNVQDLLYDFTKWDSVIREFEIIGEASKYLLKSSLLNKDYQVVVDFRNQIAHGYFGIDQDIVWTIIHNDIIPFEKAIIELINHIEPNLKNELLDSFIKDNHYLDFIVEKLKSLY